MKEGEKSGRAFVPFSFGGVFLRYDGSASLAAHRFWCFWFGGGLFC